jgi:hypothetical protein
MCVLGGEQQDATGTRHGEAAQHPATHDGIRAGLRVSELDGVEV